MVRFLPVEDFVAAIGDLRFSVMISSNQLDSKGLQGSNLLLLQWGHMKSCTEQSTELSPVTEGLTDLHVNGLVKVFVLLDEGLHAVQRVTLVITGKEGFPSCHPVLCLFTVPVEELQRDEESGSGGRTLLCFKKKKKRKRGHIMAHYSVPAARGTGPTSCDAAPRPSPGRPARGLEPPVSAGSQD